MNKKITGTLLTAAILLVSLMIFSVAGAKINVAAPSIPIYDDFLYTQAYLWGATIDTTATDTVYSGDRSLAVTFEGSFRGFTLQYDSAQAISEHEVLRLWAHGDAAGQEIQLQLIDGSNSDQTNILTTIGNGWQLIEIPLSDFGSVSDMLGVKISSGSSYPATLYLDDIEVVDLDEAPAATVDPNATATPTPTLPPELDGGFHVRNGRLLDANGNDFIMRGVNHAHTWYAQNFHAFEDIADTGANAIRVVLSSGDLVEDGSNWGRNDAADVANVIAECKRLEMICVLEVHDTVGFGQKPGAVNLDTVVDYWLDIQNVLTGEEAYVIVNIGNEPYGNDGAANWTAETIDAIGRLRDAGFTHTLMVDAPNWGQDWEGIMRDNAQSVFDSDTLLNTVFSVHMYEVYGTAAPIEAYLATFVNRELPIVVGEFGDEHFGDNVDEDTILATAEQLGLGWLAWSWSGNSGGAENLDLVLNYDPDTPSGWGDRIIDGADGIAETSQIASVFTGVAPVTPTPNTSNPTNTPTPTVMNTSVPMATDTPIVSATDTPMPTATNTPMSNPNPMPSSGFSINSNGRLIDANGNDFIMRGINHAHTWYPQETGAFADIAATGANTIRVVLSSGDLVENGNDWGRNDAADVANVIQMCKDNNLICVLEVHDTVGFGEKEGAVNLDTVVDYWIDIQDVLTGEEAYVIVNIGNEPYGNSNASNWTAETISAIGRLRDAGFTHTLMVDAPNWGQDWSNTMRDNAQSVFDSDSLGNTLFSVHMYQEYGTAAPIESYLETFVNSGLPISVGEFGDEHQGQNVDEDTILATAEQLGLGYIGWSWSGNSGGAEHLDLALNFNPNSLSGWGDRLINGTDGIAETSQIASVYTTTSTPLAVSQTQPYAINTNDAFVGIIVLFMLGLSAWWFARS